VTSGSNKFNDFPLQPTSKASQVKLYRPICRPIIIIIIIINEFHRDASLAKTSGPMYSVLVSQMSVSFGWPAVVFMLFQHAQVGYG